MSTFALGFGWPIIHEAAHAITTEPIKVNMAGYHMVSKKAAPPRQPTVAKIYDPVIMIPFAASDGIGCVMIIV